MKYSDRNKLIKDVKIKLILIQGVFFYQLTFKF